MLLPDRPPLEAVVSYPSREAIWIMGFTEVRFGLTIETAFTSSRLALTHRHLGPPGVAFGSTEASGSVVSMFEKAMKASLSTQVFNLWTTAIGSKCYSAVRCTTSVSDLPEFVGCALTPRAPRLFPGLVTPPMGWLKVNDGAVMVARPWTRYFVTSRDSSKSAVDLVGSSMARGDSTYVINLLIRREEVVPWAYKSRWVNCLLYVSKDSGFSHLEEIRDASSRCGFIYRSPVVGPLILVLMRLVTVFVYLSILTSDVFYFGAC
ncbi:hypothetical protein FNV43_RR16900 [Rhamnella rubrinervis]|uniref:Uncharacterized protein n=1 Tax=Rhamnella rubrinervis TaxID=2594499 RepID=A0A8K0GZL4_9ROSA|nr:hypothetical protein FNV43_RR16900 [Rhamnella rubrinervis]